MSILKKYTVSQPNDSFKVEIEKPLGGVVIYLNRVANSVDFTKYTDNSEGLSEFVTGINVSSTYIKKSGAVENLYNSLPLTALLEYAQFHEGVVGIQGYTMVATIPVGDSGNITFDNDEKLEIVFDNIDQTLVESIELYSLDVQQFSETMPEFKKLSVANGQTEKTFNLSSYETILIPLNVSSDTVFQFQSTNGTNQRYTTKELRAIGYATNDICIAGYCQGIVLTKFGFSDYAVIKVDTYTELQITRSLQFSPAIDVISHKSLLIDNLAEVNRRNGAIKDVALAPLVRKAHTQIR